MAIAVVTSATGTFDGVDDATTGAINTTGADLLVIITSKAGDGVAATVNDSKSNTWTGLTMREVASGERVQIFYATNVAGLVGSGHTFTAVGSFMSLAVIAFSGCHTTAPYDSLESGADTFGTTLQPGSLTPSQANCVVVQGLSFNTVQSGAVSINSSYTIQDQLDRISGDRMGVASAYLVQGAAAATNPTWTAATTSMAAVAAVFKEAGGGGGGAVVRNLTLLGVG